MLYLRINRIVLLLVGMLTIVLIPPARQLATPPTPTPIPSPPELQPRPAPSWEAHAAPRARPARAPSSPARTAEACAAWEGRARHLPRHAATTSGKGQRYVMARTLQARHASQEASLEGPLPAAPAAWALTHRDAHLQQPAPPRASTAAHQATHAPSPRAERDARERAAHPQAHARLPHPAATGRAPQGRPARQTGAATDKATPPPRCAAPVLFALGTAAQALSALPGSPA